MTESSRLNFRESVCLIDVPEVCVKFRIPPGAPVHSMGTGRWHTSKRTQTVFPFSVREFDPDYTIVTWPGSGGYWKRVVLKAHRFVDHYPFDGRPTWDKIDVRELEGKKP
jgi:hypothetical protein